VLRPPGVTISSKTLKREATYQFLVAVGRHMALEAQRDQVREILLVGQVTELYSADTLLCWHIGRDRVGRSGYPPLRRLK
jgi:hypothetical protein